MHSVALTTSTHRALVEHLNRRDGQEDVCFALWRPSTGATRQTALIAEPILPIGDERQVHGNASFSAGYFLRAADLASAADAGLALLHSHPRGRGWQAMSRDDRHAERSLTAQAKTLTGRDLVGMTLSGDDGSWSARRWTSNAGDPFHVDCDPVRVAGDQLRVSHQADGHRNTPAANPRQIRTISSWGPKAQDDLARLRVGVVGLGSVGALVAEALARTGVGHIDLIDFDTLREHNLDRVLHAGVADLDPPISKVQIARRALSQSATHPAARIDAHELSVTEPAGWQLALDCDVLFSCVDRPWARHQLNLAAYAHLIPVIDGGIRATTDARGRLRSADWRAHTAGQGRKCLQCLGQYDASAVSAERLGQLDDPHYIEGLPADDPLRARENVFAFSMSTASMEMLHLISMVVAPMRIADLGAQMYHAVAGTLRADLGDCEPNCTFSGEFLALGDAAPALIADHPAAEAERQSRRSRQGHVASATQVDDPARGLLSRLRRRLRR